MTKLSSMRLVPLCAAIAALAGTSTAVLASSHREAPSITTTPKVDAADFYMFNSYEPGRTGFVTLIADYLPLQDAYGGPNYFKLDPNALYEIHVDNVGDAKEHLTFQFRFQNALKGKTLSIGGKDVAIDSVLPFSAFWNLNWNVRCSFASPTLSTWISYSAFGSSLK